MGINQKNKIRRRLPISMTALFMIAGLNMNCVGGSSDSNDDTTDAVPAPTATTATTSTTASTVATATTTSSGVASVDSATVTATNSELVISSNLALIPAKDAAGTALRLATTEYDQDQTHYWVREGAMEPLEQAAMILCFIDQTKFYDFVNAGAYKAMINENLCEESSGGGDGQSRGLTEINLIATREDNRPLTVNGWVAGEEEGEETRFQLKIAEGSSEGNPLGIFRMTWKHDAEGSSGGLIEAYRPEGTDDVALKFFDSSNHGEGAYTAGANAVLDFDQGTGEVVGGKVTTFTESNWNGETYTGDFQVAFNQNNLLRNTIQNSEAATVCVDRTSFNSKAYRYALYDANLNRVDINSGFQIEFTDSNGDTRHGHASYWGLWTEGDQSLSNGTSVNRVEWGENGKVTTPYTVVTSPGKLVKMTAATITLGELKGVDLDYWDNSESSSYFVQWNGTNFVKTFKKVRQQNGPETLEAADGILEKNDWGSFNFYAPSLSASINLPGEGLSDSFEIRYHVEEMVSGTDQVPSGNLICISECLKVDSSTTDFSSDSQNGPYLTTTVDWGNGNSYETRWPSNSDTALATYTYSNSTHNIAISGTEFALPTGLTRETAGNWGWLSTGPLIPEEAYNALSNKDQKSPWDLRNELDTYYVWRSGFDSWSKWTGMADANGNIASFDKPLVLDYTHSQVNDMDGQADKPHYGKKFVLNYGGFGELWGIPFRYDTNSGHEEPLFAIKPGVKIGDYTIKPLDVAQVPTIVDAANCAGLSLDNLPPKTTAEDRKSFTIGDAPTEELATKVLSGEIQEGE